MRQKQKKRTLRMAVVLLCVLSWGSGGWVWAQGVLSGEAQAGGIGTETPRGIARCDLTVGRPVFCGAPYMGQAVLLQRGAYHLCDITLGTARFCYGLYTGRAIVRQERGGYARCDVTVGRITFCDAPYTGTAVIPQSAE